MIRFAETIARAGYSPRVWPPELESIIRSDVALADRTTVRLGGRARWFAEPRSDEEVGAVLAAARARRARCLVLGGGSNLLAPDGDIDAVVVHPVRLDGFEVVGDRIHAGAGLALANLVARANDAALAGAQVLAGIPGQIGGAIAMNAGGRYGEIAEIVESVGLRLADGSAATLAKAVLDFGYRRARLPEGAVVVRVTLKLTPVEDRRALKRESGRILKEKNEAQPTTGWNFGCMFKNPPERSAGRILDAAGARGLERGRARISPKHANFVENLGGATSADVLWLIEEAERLAWEHEGVRLEREVRVWRAQDPAP
jgi:UDP-N-acetylmuramate dehydrogenase